MITIYQGPRPDRSFERISFVSFVIFIPLQRLPPSSGDYSIGYAKTKERPFLILASVIEHSY